MFDYSRSELQVIDANLEPKLAWATQRQAQCEQMAMDATRLLSCTEGRLKDYENQGFFKRCWSSLSGKTGDIQRANQNDLIEMQKYAWRYINLLQERELLLAHSLITVKNNLLTLAVEQEDIKAEIKRLAERVLDRFEQLEDRVDRLEKNVDLLDWVTNIETRDYDEKFPPNMRMLRVVGDFFALKSHSWSVRDLAYLRTAMKNTGFSVKEEISIGSFVDGLLGEIREDKIHQFTPLVHPSIFGDKISDDFILDAVASPSFCALYEIKRNYSSSSSAVSALSDHLEISHEEAIKIILNKYIQKRGIDRNVSLPLKDLAIEMVGCFGVVLQLANAKFKTKNSKTGASDHNNGVVNLVSLLSGALDPSSKKKLNLSFDEHMSRAKEGDSESQYWIGLAYFHGKDVGMSDEKAFSWFMKAAEQGNADGQYMLGLMYHKGFGLDNECNKSGYSDTDDEWYNYREEKAIYWLRAAASQGDIDAQYMLGDIYYDGVYDGSEEDVIIDQDYKKAFSWFMKAAEQGDPSSQFKVSEMYECGEGVSEDADKASYWSDKAVEYQDDESKRKPRGYDQIVLQKSVAMAKLANERLQAAVASLPDDDEEDA